jgi:microcystin-dependent protein
MPAPEISPGLLPVGAILAYAGQNPGSLLAHGWAECNGQVVTGPQFQELFDRIGYTFGRPLEDGFNTPDLRGLFIRGANAGGQGRDPDAALRTRLRPGGAVGDGPGTYQNYATAAPRSGFNFTLGRSWDRSKVEGIFWNTHDVFWWNDAGSNFQGGFGGDLETRPLNRYVYFIIKYRSLNPDGSPPQPPIGSVIPFAGITARGITDRWVYCDGTAEQNTGEFGPLFQAIGFAHGGESETQFCLPDYRGTFLRAVDGSANRDPGAGSRPAPRPSLPKPGNTGDAVGSAQDAATAWPTGANGFWTTINHLGGTYAKNPMIDNATGRHIYRRKTDSTTLNLTAGGGDAETRPVNVAVDWFIRFR